MNVHIVSVLVTHIVGTTNFLVMKIHMTNGGQEYVVDILILNVPRNFIVLIRSMMIYKCFHVLFRDTAWMKVRVIWKFQKLIGLYQLKKHIKPDYFILMQVYVNIKYSILVNIP